MDDRTISISGSSVELQSLSGKEGSEKTKKQDSHPTGNEVSASINLDQTIGMDAALQKTLQEKEEIPEEKQESLKFFTCWLQQFGRDRQRRNGERFIRRNRIPYKEMSP